MFVCTYFPQFKIILIVYVFCDFFAAKTDLATQSKHSLAKCSNDQVSEFPSCCWLPVHQMTSIHICILYIHMVKECVRTFATRNSDK